MYSSISKLDRDIARSFLKAPTNTISYRPIAMKNQMIIPYQSMNSQEPILTDMVPQPHPNAQLAYPTSSNIIPMYYDVIIDTVTDYDIFYPIAKQTQKHYYNPLPPANEQQSISDENSIYPRYHVERLDEFAVSIDFPHDHNSNNHDEPTKTVRFNDNPSCISYSTNPSIIPHNQYYFQPETFSHIDNQHSSSSVRYISTPFFWFRPVINNNYAICIPTTTRPSLHAYITTTYDPQFQTAPTPNPIRL